MSSSSLAYMQYVIVESFLVMRVFLKMSIIWLVKVMLLCSLLVVGCFSDVTAPEVPAISNPSNSAAGLALVGCGNTKAVEEILKLMSPALAAFVTNLPAVEGITSFHITRFYLSSFL